MTTLETLKAARAKIADEKHWTQEEYARGENEGLRGAVYPTSPIADCWCAVGAIGCVNGCLVGDFEPFAEAFGLSEDCLVDFNDSHTHAEVLVLFDRAIASLEAA